MYLVSMTTDSFLISNDHLGLIIARRDEIIDIIKTRFAEKLSLNLPIFGIERPNLKEFTTTERDAKRG